MRSLRASACTVRRERFPTVAGEGNVRSPHPLAATANPAQIWLSSFSSRSFGLRPRRIKTLCTPPQTPYNTVFCSKRSAVQIAWLAEASTERRGRVLALLATRVFGGRCYCHFLKEHVTSRFSVPRQRIDSTVLFFVITRHVSCARPAQVQYSTVQSNWVAV